MDRFEILEGHKTPTKCTWRLAIFTVNPYTKFEIYQFYTLHSSAMLTHDNKMQLHVQLHSGSQKTMLGGNQLASNIHIVWLLVISCDSYTVLANQQVSAVIDEPCNVLRHTHDSTVRQNLLTVLTKVEWLDWVGLGGWWNTRTV